MFLDALMIVATEFGSPQNMLFMCSAVAVFLFVHNKPKHFLQFVIFMSLGATSVLLIKQALQIQRPIGSIIVEYGYGFPSGHATMVTLFSLLVVYAYVSHIKNQEIKFLFILAAFLFIGMVSYSRIYLGVHTYADVSAGIVLGTFWFLSSVIFYTRLHHGRHK